MAMPISKTYNDRVKLGEIDGPLYSPQQSSWVVENYEKINLASYTFWVILSVIGIICLLTPIGDIKL